MSSDPTFERVDDPVSNWWQIIYRSTFCSFGLEAVNNDTGYYTRTALLGDMFDYINDDLSVTFDADVDTATREVVFTAEVMSSVGGEAIQYRWDFGDDSEYITSTINTITHQYAQLGTYEARVEVIDTYMHSAVSAPVQIEVEEIVVFLPLILRNQ